MAVPLLDLRKQYASIRDEVLRVTEEVYESQAFILGRRVEDFERDFASYCHSKHAVGVSSGTDALLIALMVLEVGAGDEVIVPAYSFFATAGVVERLGAVPVFVDIEPRGFNIDPALVEQAITPRTRAIMPVHLYGQVAAMDEIDAIAARRGIAVLEDAAQAVGAELDGRRAGSLGRLACFSFFPSKNLGAFGDAGAVTTDDDELHQKLVDYRVHGMRPKYFHRAVGGNFRIDALQAAILHVKLPHLDSWTEGRRRNAEWYREAFAGSKGAERIELPELLPGRRHVMNQFVIRFREGREVRDRVMAGLRERSIGCEIYYPLPLPSQKCFAHHPSTRRSFPVSDAAAAETLAIPIYPELTRAQMEEVVAAIEASLP
ncbi:MAG TPA: DegT/DnrJ/EryC1/StrS family aminotransferase [Thermoanaerobaculia bacterium]|nr:DegT/DnrJ/EryC1/StrS family aminotransferase [Thermoanaerobaculia bacterium]